MKLNERPACAGVDRALTVGHGPTGPQGMDGMSGSDGAMGDDTVSDIEAGGDPFQLFAAWFAEAEKNEINDPNAIALATVDTHGMPNVRMVLLKGVDEPGHPARGFVLFTNTESAKGRELLANPRAAFVMHWKSIRRQVRVRGDVTVVSDAEADEYFATRPHGSRIGAWASSQSRPMSSRAELIKRVAEYEVKFLASGVPRPPHWTGFRITPVEIEFWRDRKFRLHDRVVFRRASPTAQWQALRLFP